MMEMTNLLVLFIVTFLIHDIHGKAIAKDSNALDAVKLKRSIEDALRLLIQSDSILPEDAIEKHEDDKHNTRELDLNTEIEKLEKVLEERKRAGHVDIIKDKKKDETKRVTTNQQKDTKSVEKKHEGAQTKDETSTKDSKRNTRDDEYWSGEYRKKDVTSEELKTKIETKKETKEEAKKSAKIGTAKEEVETSKKSALCNGNKKECNVRKTSLVKKKKREEINKKEKTKEKEIENDDSENERNLSNLLNNLETSELSKSNVHQWKDSVKENEKSVEGLLHMLREKKRENDITNFRNALEDMLQIINDKRSYVTEYDLEDIH